VWLFELASRVAEYKLSATITTVIRPNAESSFSLRV
jgi:hypothetical protein